MTGHLRWSKALSNWKVRELSHSKCHRWRPWGSVSFNWNKSPQAHRLQWNITLHAYHEGIQCLWDSFNATSWPSKLTISFIEPNTNILTAYVSYLPQLVEFWVFFWAPVAVTIVLLDLGMPPWLMIIINKFMFYLGWESLLWPSHDIFYPQVATKSKIHSILNRVAFLYF